MFNRDNDEVPLLYRLMAVVGPAWSFVIMTVLLTYALVSVHKFALNIHWPF